MLIRGIKNKIEPIRNHYWVFHVPQYSYIKEIILIQDLNFRGWGGKGEVFSTTTPLTVCF